VFVHRAALFCRARSGSRRNAQAFKGGHVDFHISVAAAMGGRLLVRLPDGDARVRWPIGARVGIAVSGEQTIAFLRL
jgi:hypothetical protein